MVDPGSRVERTEAANAGEETRVGEGPGWTGEGPDHDAAVVDAAAVGHVAGERASIAENEDGAGRDRQRAEQTAGDAQRAALHVGAAGVGVVARQHQSSGALQGQAAGARYVVAPDIEGVEAAERGVHVDRDVAGKGAIAAGGGVEIEPGPAGAVVERPARRQFGGGENLVELVHAEVGKPRLDQHVRVGRHDRRQIRRADRGKIVGQIIGVVLCA